MAWASRTRETKEALDASQERARGCERQQEIAVACSKVSFAPSGCSGVAWSKRGESGAYRFGKAKARAAPTVSGNRSWRSLCSNIQPAECFEAHEDKT